MGKEKRRARQDDRNMKRDEFGSECSLSEWSSEYDSLSSEGDADIQTIADAEEHFEEKDVVSAIAEGTEEEEIVISLDDLAVEDNKQNDEDQLAAMVDTAVH